MSFFLPSPSALRAPRQRRFLHALAVCAPLCLLSACGGGRDAAAPPPGDLVAVAAFAPAASAAGVVVADAPLPRPTTAACTVKLYDGMSFQGFDAHSFAYAGAGACAGPWAKVVLEADFAVNAGRQFDRTALISIGGINLYAGTTQEPSANVAPSWHVERDVTDYAKALTASADGFVRLDNVVDSTYTGLLTGSARLVFYPAGSSADAASTRAADLVIPLAGDLKTGDPANLKSAADALQRTMSLPTNMVRLYLDVQAESQGGDEFWYTCVPDDQAQVLQSCGGGSFREVLVRIDGQPAGLAPVVPRVYTGGVDPGLWRPTPGAETLSFVPSRVDLTPFAGALSDGTPHTVAISVQGAQDHFAVVGSLLVYQDAAASQTGGALSSNTLASAALTPPVTSNGITTAADSSVGGTLGVTAAHSYAVTGYVNTSSGRVTTTVQHDLTFSNQQKFNIAGAIYRQALTQRTTSTATVTTEGSGRRTVDRIALSYPLDMDYTYDGDKNRQDATAAQDFRTDVSRTVNGGDAFHSAFRNTLAVKSALLFSSTGGPSQRGGEEGSQTVTYEDSLGSCYQRSVVTAANVLASFQDGAGCTGGNRLNWLAQPDGAPAQALLGRISEP